MSKKRIGLIAVAATLIMGIAVYAATGMISMWYGSSSSFPDYTQLPTKEQCMKDIGYSPIVLEKFENGYTFTRGNIVKNDLKDEANNSVEKFKSLQLEYSKGDSKLLCSAMKYDSEMETDAKLIAEIDGTNFYYDTYTNKAVPANYHLTEEDKEAEKKGELVFSYGANDVTISEVQGLSWEYDGIHYNFTQIDGELTADELVEMAREMIQ